MKILNVYVFQKSLEVLKVTAILAPEDRGISNGIDHSYRIRYRMSAKESAEV